MADAPLRLVLSETDPIIVKMGVGSPGADGAGVPAGGTEDQHLVKSSATDYDTEWATPVGSDAASVRALGFFDITNDGTGSGLDADLLDGLEGSGYATAAQGSLADSAVQDAADIRALGFFDVSNDGAASGLDADLLDGLEGSGYATAAQGTLADSAVQDAADIRALGFFDVSNDGAASGLDADLLDGVEGSGYMLAGAALANVVEDTLPRLGGDLDVLARAITSSVGGLSFTPNNNISAFTGNITVTGTVDGRDVAADGATLDGLGAGGIANVVEDTAPKLGGDLDTNSQAIVTASGNLVLTPAGITTTAKGVSIGTTTNAALLHVGPPASTDTQDILLAPAGTDGCFVSATADAVAVIESATSAALVLRAEDGGTDTTTLKITNTTAVTTFDAKTDDYSGDTAADILVLRHSDGFVGVGDPTPDVNLTVAAGATSTDLRIYNSEDGGSTGEWAQLGWSATADTFTIGTGSDAGGTDRPVTISTGAGNLTLAPAGDVVITGTVTTASGDLTISPAGDLIVPSGTDLEVQGGDVTVTGDVILNGSMYVQEASDAAADKVNYSQIWSKVGTPVTLWWTDSGGTNYQLINAAATPVAEQVAVFTSAQAAGGDAGLTWDGSTLAITGSLTATGTVDGIDIATDVAANTAKVTCDTTNVTAAGALMDSELGANVQTFLGTPTTANLLAAVTGETGTGAVVFATSPTLVTPALGTPASGVLTNCTGYAAATTSLSGIAELATAAETTAGTDTGRTVTPDSLAGSVHGEKSVCLVSFASDAAVETGNGTIAFTIPAQLNGMELVAATASVTDKGVTGTTTVMVRKRSGGADADMLTTGITLGDEFFASDGALKTNGDEDVATGDQIYIDVDTIHSGTAPNGLSTVITFRTK